YLWPMMQERVAAHTGRHTLYMFEEIASPNRPNLGEVRYAAIDLRDEWREVLRRAAASSHAWLLEHLRGLPPAPELSPDLGLAVKLLPSEGGKLVGRVLSQYRLAEVIGRGGFGTVYLAEGPGAQRVAVKVIELADSFRHLSRFQREFEKLHTAGGHPHIIQCYDWGSDIIEGREYPWYSMEYALGGDLGSRLDERQGKLPSQAPWEDPDLREQIVEEFRSITDAVAHLHDLDIVHRDIKPANVLILEDGTLRLSDFGLVKSLDPSETSLRESGATSTGAVVGTRHYM